MRKISVLLRLRDERVEDIQFESETIVANLVKIRNFTAENSIKERNLTVFPILESVYIYNCGKFSGIQLPVFFCEITEQLLIVYR